MATTQPSSGSQSLNVPPEVQQQLQSLSEDYQKLQNDISSAVQTRQRLNAQQTENESVLKEFKALPNDTSMAQIYKLTGPVLLKQERGEAEMAVTSRLEYIKREMERVEEQIKEYSEQSEGKKMEIVQIQTEAQQATQSAQSATV